MPGQEYTALHSDKTDVTGSLRHVSRSLLRSEKRHSFVRMRYGCRETNRLLVGYIQSLAYSVHAMTADLLAVEYALSATDLARNAHIVMP